ncbi:hypothetical protein NPIL_267311 [Nephila pilipes]|uniref:Uncharacterized protein n=1 Tax=Nephila pilipes TaxID=299642 RepID=A0A8X6MPW8_NEPPI|nr:hypothetical protein NPIL_267311 [Nephila pilipes]
MVGPQNSRQEIRQRLACDRSPIIGKYLGGIWEKDFPEAKRKDFKWLNKLCQENCEYLKMVPGRLTPNQPMRRPKSVENCISGFHKTLRESLSMVGEKTFIEFPTRDLKTLHVKDVLGA